MQSNCTSVLTVPSVLRVYLGIGGGTEVPSRETEGQHSLDKFNSVGRNSLSLDIFSPVTDGMCLFVSYTDAVV